MRRRNFISVLGGAAIVWPLVARAQQPRLVGMLLNRAADSPDAQPRLAAFRQGLQDLGWSEGRDVRIEVRWGANDPDIERKYANELVALAPNIVVAGGTLGVLEIQRITRTIPIVFVAVTDPVGAGVVNSLAHPGGNATGFMVAEYGFSGKWLELLKQIVPNLTRVAVLRNPGVAAGIAQFGAIQAMAQSLGVEVRPINVGDAKEMERDIATFAASENGGLITTGSGTVHSDLIVALAARYKLPAIYPYSDEVTAGGLVSYGPDLLDQYRHAAGYVDRILKGEGPVNLPVIQPTKYVLVINMKTAKALGLTVPQSLLARADEVIE